MNTPPFADTQPVPTPLTRTEPLSGRTTPDESRSGVSESDKLLAHQTAFLLDQLLQAAPEHRMGRREANQKLGALVRKHLEIDPATANRMRDQLAGQGYIRVMKRGQAVTYELTDEGREHLQTLEQYPFPPGRGKAGKAINENVVQYVKPYLLLQLFQAQRRTLTKGEANRFDSLGRELLVLTPTNVQPVRAEMASEGLIEITRRGRSESYSLTPAGIEFLAANEQYPGHDFKIKGDSLNALLRAARAATAPEAHPASAFSARPADLSGAVFAEFLELRREEYGHTGLVPIFRIRERIAAKYGPNTARHHELDEPILQLARDGRTRLVALADLQKATPEQLNASVPGVNETLFYLELARG